MTGRKYRDITLDLHADEQIGVITFRRPKSLNSFGGKMLLELKHALRVLDKHPKSVFTVVTGEGRFFSSGADVKAQGNSAPITADNEAELKEIYAARFGPSVDLLRDMINHSKVLVMAYNGPGVGGGAAWFAGVSDLLYASDIAYLQVPFGALGLIPEAGSGVHYAENMGPRRTMEFMMFGSKLDAQAMLATGMANRILPFSTFHADLLALLTQQLKDNDPGSILLTKKLVAGPLKEKRMKAVVEAQDVLADRFVDGAPEKRFKKKAEEMVARSKAKI